MCSECYCNPCRSGCPNASEPEPVYICDNCDDGIYDGEPYYSIDGKCFCEGCIDAFRYIAETPEPYEPDPMDLWKARMEAKLIDE